MCLLVSGAVLFLPMILGEHTVTWTDILVGFLAQFTTASTGVAIGLLGFRLVIRRPGYALLSPWPSSRPSPWPKGSPR